MIATVPVRFTYLAVSPVFAALWLLRMTDREKDVVGTAGIATVLTGVRIPRMNSIIERWVKTLRTELLDRTLIWNHTHLRRALREYERHYNEHRTHRSLAAAAPLRTLPQPLEPDQIERLTVDRRDRLGVFIHDNSRTAA